MRAVFLTVAVAVTALRFSHRNALLKKVSDFEASNVAHQESRSDLANSIVADFEASSVAYQKSRSGWDAGNFSGELESAEFALPRQDAQTFDEDKFLDEVYREAQEDEKASKASKVEALKHPMDLETADELLDNSSRRLDESLELWRQDKVPQESTLPSRMEEADDLLHEREEDSTPAPPKPAHKSHMLSRLRAHKRARAHALTVDLPDAPTQQDLCDPGITVCLPCDGTDVSDTHYIPRVLESIAAQTCLPSKVILAVSGISDEQSAQLVAELPDYKDLFPLQALPIEMKQSAGLNRNRCARAADTEVLSFFDVDDIMHPRRLELLSLAFGTYQPKAIVHAYEEVPKSSCEGRAPMFRNRKFGSTLQIYDGIGIYDLSMTPDADAKNSLRTPNARGLNHAGHISVLRSVFSEVQQSTLARGQDAKFARDILKHFGRHEDTMACLNAPLTLYCNHGTILWLGL